MSLEPGFAVAGALGAEALANWTQDGQLIGSEQLAKAWGLAAQAIQNAVQRGDLFEVWVKESPYFPSVLIPLGFEQASRLCRSLKIQTAAGRLVFLLRPLGGLGGKTVVQSLQSNTPLCRIKELADAWARN